MAAGNFLGLGGSPGATAGNFLGAGRLAWGDGREFSGAGRLAWVYFEKMPGKFLSSCSNRGFLADRGRISSSSNKSSCLFTNVWVSG